MNLANINFNIYPNPSYGKLYLENNQNFPLNYSIIDLHGKDYIKSNPLNENFIDISFLPENFFILIIEHGDNKKFFKFLKVN
jgi:hypothetical protein